MHVTVGGPTQNGTPHNMQAKHLVALGLFPSGKASVLSEVRNFPYSSCFSTTWHARTHVVVVIAAAVPLVFHGDSPLTDATIGPTRKHSKRVRV